MGTSCSNQDIIDENNINIERIETLEDDIDKLKTEKEELNF
jgi:DNA-dependent RNA polymerase auxiliary subunit epsilon